MVCIIFVNAQALMENISVKVIHLRMSHGEENQIETKKEKECIKIYGDEVRKLKMNFGVKMEPCGTLIRIH